MPSPRREWLHVVVVAYLVLQVGWILTVPWHHERTFAWAPLHEQARFRIEVMRQGQRLSDEEVRARYGHGRFFDATTGEDWQLNELTRALDVIERIEAQKSDGAVVTVRFRRNGRSAEEWHWPPR